MTSCRIVLLCLVRAPFGTFVCFLLARFRHRTVGAHEGRTFGGTVSTHTDMYVHRARWNASHFTKSQKTNFASGVRHVARGGSDVTNGKW